MTTWIQSSNTKQDGTPVTRRIKIPEMAEEIWFTTNAYAETADDVADILANNIDSISKVSEPSDPGEYYGDAGENTTIQINISDGVFDAITAESGDLDTLSAVEGRFEKEPWHDVTQYGAVGDGSTDDRQAIQDAVDAAAPYGDGVGGVVYFPAGTYLVNDKVRWKNNVALISGRPWNGATIKAGPDLDAAVFGNGAEFHNVQLWGLEIDGSDGWTNYSYSPAHKAIASNPETTDDGTWGLSIEYCHVHDIRATGIGCDSIPFLNINNCILERCGTDGQTTGSNGIGTGIGEMTGYCPMWMENNIVIDTAEFGIILEQTGDTQRSHGQYINNNYVADAKVGIAGELTSGATCSGNVVVASSRMEHGFLWDTLDNTFGPEWVSGSDNTVKTPNGSTASPDVAAVEIGTDATWCGFDVSVDVQNENYPDMVNDGTFSVLNGIGTEAAGFGNSPSDSGRWEQMNVQRVRNSDDGAEWSLDHNRNWKQTAPADFTNLSGKTASFGGFIAYDDGTNTSGNGVRCQWDNANSQWIPFDGSTAFA